MEKKSDEEIQIELSNKINQLAALIAKDKDLYRIIMGEQGQDVIDFVYESFDFFQDMVLEAASK